MHLSLCDQFASPRALQDLPGQSTPSKKTQHVQEISLEATLKEKQPSEVLVRPAWDVKEEQEG